MDIFSRKIVYWEVHESQSELIASQMIDSACLKEKIERGQIVLHADNGRPMKGATMLSTLERLGVTPSFSRPRVSDDNPYIAQAFLSMALKVLKRLESG